MLSLHRFIVGARAAGWCSLAFVILLAACEKAPPAPPLPPFKPAATNKELMDEVIEPAANVYWDAVGSVTDKRGTVEKAPRTDDEWKAVRNAAMVVAESGNLLMIEPRVRDRGQWMALARGLVLVGEKARKAAESRDKKAVFDVGAEVYQACVNCHSIYLVGPLAPPK